MKTIQRRVRGTDIMQTYTLYPTAQSARGDSQRGATIIALFAARRDEEVGVGAIGYDWIPRGQPLPERARIVADPRTGRLAGEQDEDVDSRDKTARWLP